MKKISRFLQYLKFYFEPQTKVLQAEALNSARAYYAERPLRSAQRPYPLPSDYSFRREEFQQYQQAFVSSYRHTYAKTKLALSQGEK